MTIQDDVRVQALIADHIAIDANGRATLLGLGLTIAALTGGTTPPQHLIVIVELPANYQGTQYSVSIELRHEARGELVSVVGPNGVTEALRVAQVVTAERSPAVPGIALPADLPLRNQMGLAFPTGVRLPGLGKYTWQVEIDGHYRRGWDASFWIVGPPQQPVFGGPLGSTSLPQFPGDS